MDALRTEKQQLKKRVEVLEEQMRAVQTNLLHQVSVATDMQKTYDENKATMLTIEDTIHKRMDAVEGQVDTALELLTPAQLPKIPSPS